MREPGRQVLQWKGPFQSLQLGHVEPGQPGPRRHALSALGDVRDRAVAKHASTTNVLLPQEKLGTGSATYRVASCRFFFGVAQNNVTPALRNMEDVSGCGRHESGPSAGNSTGGAIRKGKFHRTRL